MSHGDTTKRLIDSAEARFAKLRRVNPTELVSHMNGTRLDRLIQELPETITAMQNILTAAQTRQTQLRTGKK